MGAFFRSWAVLVALGSLLGRLDAVLVALGSLLGRLAAVLGRSWSVLGRSCAVLGRSWPLLGRSWAVWGRSWGGLGEVLERLGELKTLIFLWLFNAIYKIDVLNTPGYLGWS